MPQPEGVRRETEIEGRVSALEAGQQAIQEDIRELTQVVTDLAHETRRSLSVMQRPNWQYMAVVLGIALAIGSLYVRDQEKQEKDVKSLRDWRVESVRAEGYKAGVLDCLSKEINQIRSELEDR